MADHDFTNLFALASPLRDKQPQMRAPQPTPTPGFSQRIADQTPTREGVASSIAANLGFPADTSAFLLHKMGIPINMQSDSNGEGQMADYPNVPFGTLWWRNAINNPSVTWDQVRAAFQSPSMHSMRGIGGLF